MGACVRRCVLFVGWVCEWVRVYVDVCCLWGGCVSGCV